MAPLLVARHRRVEPNLFMGSLKKSHVLNPGQSERERERRFRVYEEAPGFRPGPRVMTRVQARGDWVVLSIVYSPLATFCPRQPLVRAQRP